MLIENYISQKSVGLLHITEDFSHRKFLNRFRVKFKRKKWFVSVSLLFLKGMENVTNGGLWINFFSY